MNVRLNHDASCGGRLAYRPRRPRPPQPRHLPDNGLIGVKQPRKNISSCHYCLLVRSFPKFELVPFKMGYVLPQLVDALRGFDSR